MGCLDCSNKCNQISNNNIQVLPKISGGFLNVTQKCNLKCKYCFVHQQPIEMSYEVAKDAADFYAKNALESNTIPSINFFGGEPLLRWNDIIVPLTKYIREVYEDKYTLGLTTNGVLLDREKLEFMKENNIGFLVSIDGDKKTQDFNRPFHNGKGSFDLLKEKIPLFLEYNPNLTFRATVNHDNVYEMSNNYLFAIEMGYNNVFMIPNIFIEWSSEEREELKRQCIKIADIYLDLIKQGRKVEFNQFSDAKNKIAQLNKLIGSNSYRDQGIRFPAFGRCGLGGTKFASIGASGDIYSCQELVESPELGDKFKIGNIYTGVDAAARWKIMSNFDTRNVRRSDNKTCRDCALNKICTGACTINNYLATGDLEIMPTILCEYYQIMIEQQMRIEHTLMMNVPIITKFV